MNKKRNIIVIDLKAFYSYVECLDRGLDPWTTPLVVADKERGTNTIVLSVSPFLKSHGIPSRLRLKKLPKKFDYIYAVPRMERYIEKSLEVINVFLEYVSEDDIHVYSIDEAFIDITTYLSYYKKTALEMAEFLVNEVKNKTGLQATAGVGENMFLAKVALDVYAKKEKNGIATMYKKDVETKLWPITPLNKIWGIGARTEAKLNKMGMFSVRDIALSNPDFLRQKFGIMGEQLYEHSHGNDEADMHEEYTPKETSMTYGQVLFRDFKKEEMSVIIQEMTDELASRLREAKKMTSVVSLFISYSKNQGGFAKQMSLLHPTSDQKILYDALMEIFKKNVEDKPIRGVHLAFGKLQNQDYQQLNVFEDTNEQIADYDLQLALDVIHQKFGKNSVLRASSLTESSTIKERHNQIGGHRR